MGQTFLLVTVMFAGQVQEGPIEVYGQSWEYQHAPRRGWQGMGLRERVRSWWSPAPDYSEYGAQPQPGVVSRIRGWFGGQEGPIIEYDTSTFEGGMPANSGPVTTIELPYSGMQVTSEEPPLAGVKSAKNPKNKQETPASHGPSQVQQVEYRRPTTSNNGVINKKFLDKIGHEDDYSWLTGQLVRSGTGWVIHYATPDTPDVYNGRLAVLSGVDMSRVSDGDLVCIQGQVVQLDQGAAYRPSAVFLIERK